MRVSHSKIVGIAWECSASEVSEVSIFILHEDILGSTTGLCPSVLICYLLGEKEKYVFGYPCLHLIPK